MSANSRLVVIVERGKWHWPWRYFVILDGGLPHAEVLTGLALTEKRAEREAQRRADNIAKGLIWGWPDDDAGLS